MPACRTYDTNYCNRTLVDEHLSMSHSPQMLQLEHVRLDVWLDVTCLFRTRSEAQKACKGGKVDVNGQRAKPHRDIRAGDQIAITRPNGIKQQVAVQEVSEQNLPKAVARTLYRDTTPPPSTHELVFRRLLQRIGPAANSPDKRERRRLRRLQGK